MGASNNQIAGSWALKKNIEFFQEHGLWREKLLRLAANIPQTKVFLQKIKWQSFCAIMSTHILSRWSKHLCWFKPASGFYQVPLMHVHPSLSFGTLISPLPAKVSLSTCGCATTWQPYNLLSPTTKQKAFMSHYPHQSLTWPKIVGALKFLFCCKRTEKPDYFSFF